MYITGRHERRHEQNISHFRFLFKSHRWLKCPKSLYRSHTKFWDSFLRRWLRIGTAFSIIPFPKHIAWHRTCNGRISTFEIRAVITSFGGNFPVFKNVSVKVIKDTMPLSLTFETISLFGFNFTRIDLTPTISKQLSRSKISMLLLLLLLWIQYPLDHRRKEQISATLVRLSVTRDQIELSSVSIARSLFVFVFLVNRDLIQSSLLLILIHIFVINF